LINKYQLKLIHFLALAKLITNNKKIQIYYILTYLLKKEKPKTPLFLIKNGVFLIKFKLYKLLCRPEINSK